VLAPLGLRLSPAKTRIVHDDEGFPGRLAAVLGDGGQLVDLQDAFDLDGRRAGAMRWFTVRVAGR
jgi:hypothetical protein